MNGNSDSDHIRNVNKGDQIQIWFLTIRLYRWQTKITNITIWDSEDIKEKTLEGHNQLHNPINY